jgi:hypothetical protein
MRAAGLDVQAADPARGGGMIGPAGFAGENAPAQGGQFERPSGPVQMISGVGRVRWLAGSRMACDSSSNLGAALSADGRRGERQFGF